MRGSKAVGEHYMLVTTLIAALTAGVNLCLILGINGSHPLIGKIEPGLGLAAIGIITFFGVSLSSSVFEEHRHDHKDPKNKNNTGRDNLIPNIIAGKGIMRKGLAASLVMTYIVLIGLSFNAGTLNDSFSTNDLGVSSIINSNETTYSKDVITNIVIKDIVTLGDKVESVNESVQVIESGSLVQHFTIVITAVIGFYFGANILTSLLKDKKEEDPLKILKVRFAKGEITREEFNKIKSELE